MCVSTTAGATMFDIHVPKTWRDDDGFIHAEVGALPNAMKRHIPFEFLLSIQEPGHTSITFEVSAGGAHGSNTLTIDRPAVLDTCDPQLDTQVACTRRVAKPYLLRLHTEIAMPQVTSSSKGRLLKMSAHPMGFASSRGFSSGG